MSVLPSSSAKPLIYLASASPRRSALLAQIGVAHRVAPVAVDESVAGAEAPEQYVARLAALKAGTLWQSLPEDQRLPVLGSDTAVVVDRVILGKPSDENDCVRMLQLLSGRTHQVHTAVAVRSAAGSDVRLSVSDVTFRTLTPAEMRAYWRTGEPADKAGGYAIQGRGAVFISHIAGSYSGIMGLPLFETAELLAAHRIDVQVDEAQADEAQADEAQADEAQADEAQADEAQANEAQASDIQTSEVQTRELRASDTKASGVQG